MTAPTITGTARGHLRAFFAFTALWYGAPVQALWILYLLHSGWTLVQVGEAEAGFHIVSLLSDLPTGAFADRYGRRASLCVGLLLAAATQAGQFLYAPHSFGLGALFVSLSALGWTFVGGADRALLYGIASASPGGSPAYGRMYGTAVMVSFLAAAAGAAGGGLLVQIGGYGFPYALTIAMSLAALFAVMALPPPAEPEGEAQAPGLGTVLADAWRVLRVDGPLARYLLFGAFLSLCGTLNGLYGQSTLAMKGAPVVWVTAAIGAANLVAAAASHVGGRLAGGGRPMRALSAASVISGAFLALVGALPLAGSVASFLGVYAAGGAAEPIYDTELNRRAPERLRATVLSMPSTGFSLGMIVLFPVAGWMMAHGDLPWAYAGLAAALWAVTAACVRPRGGRFGDLRLEEPVRAGRTGPGGWDT